jgi:hypothetical protein
MSEAQMTSKQQHEIADRVRDECIQTALAAYESASISGLCGEGAFEAAISAMRMMNLDRIIEQTGDGNASETER